MKISKYSLFFAIMIATGAVAESGDNKDRQSHKHGDLHNSTEMSMQKHVESSIDPQAFVEKASASGFAEIELAKMALEKSTQTDVREFAQTMIEDHKLANKELRELAQAEGLKLADDATLTKKAKAYVLSQKDGESFDMAYANNQVAAHEEAVKLFRKAANTSDKEVREFAKAKLPTLEYHLNLARALADTVAQIHSSEERTSKGSHNPEST